MTPMPSSGTAIHEAFRAADGSGGVRLGRTLTRAEAISHRQSGSDVVVCGGNTFANALKAHRIESAVGPCIPDGSHLDTAGPMALPHFQQKQPPPEGHTFYETPIRKAVP